MNWSTLILLLIIALLQYPLWLGKGGWVRVWEYERQVQAQREVLQRRQPDDAPGGLGQQRVQHRLALCGVQAAHRVVGGIDAPDQRAAAPDDALLHAVPLAE